MRKAMESVVRSLTPGRVRAPTDGTQEDEDLATSVANMDRTATVALDTARAGDGHGLDEVEDLEGVDDDDNGHETEDDATAIYGFNNAAQLAETLAHSGAWKSRGQRTKADYVFVDPALLCLCPTKPVTEEFPALRQRSRGRTVMRISVWAFEPYCRRKHQAATEGMAQEAVRGCKAHAPGGNPVIKMTSRYEGPPCYWLVHNRRLLHEAPRLTPEEYELEPEGDGESSGDELLGPRARSQTKHISAELADTRLGGNQGLEGARGEQDVPTAGARALQGYDDTVAPDPPTERAAAALDDPADPTYLPAAAEVELLNELAREKEGRVGEDEAKAIPPPVDPAPSAAEDFSFGGGEGGPGLPLEVDGDAPVPAPDTRVCSNVSCVREATETCDLCSAEICTECKSWDTGICVVCTHSPHGPPGGRGGLPPRTPAWPPGGYTCAFCPDRAVGACVTCEQRVCVLHLGGSTDAGPLCLNHGPPDEPVVPRPTRPPWERAPGPLSGGFGTNPVTRTELEGKLDALRLAQQRANEETAARLETLSLRHRTDQLQALEGRPYRRLGALQRQVVTMGGWHARRSGPDRIDLGLARTAWTRTPRGRSFHHSELPLVRAGPCGTGRQSALSAAWGSDCPCGNGDHQGTRQ